MELPSPSPARELLRTWERAVVIIDVLLGVALCFVAAWSFSNGLSAAADPNSPHGGGFEFLGAFLLGPPGVLFLLAALGVARRWRARWWLHALPFVLPLLLGVFGLG